LVTAVGKLPCLGDDDGVSRQSDWKDAVRALGLAPGEDLLTMTPAVAPGRTGGGMSMSGLVVVKLAADRIAWQRRTEAAARSSGFPLAPRMIIGVTDRRLLVWSAGSRWRVRKYLGEVSRDQITRGTAPTVGAGWRSVLIDLATGPTVTIRVPARTADRLAASLSGQSGPAEQAQEPA
jgi:hypothetical protein